jgi:hypothetical protein
MLSSARPTRVKASTTMTTHRPGGSRYHHAPALIAPALNALSSMVPQETRNGSPSPRKDSVVSERIAMATVKVVLASTSGITLGSTWRDIWCQ